MTAPVAWLMAAVASGGPGGYMDEGVADQAIGIFGGIVAASTVLGAIIGHRSGTRTIYRAQAQETN